MEFLTQRLRNSLPASLAVLLLAGAVCTACGPQVIKGRPPFVSISAMNLSESQLATQYRIDNQNGVAMTIDAIEVSVTVEDMQLTRDNRELRLLIDANSAEEYRVEETPAADVRRALASLEGGEVSSLPFQLSGRVRTQEDGYLRFEQKGHLYPVPGRPGSFRSAVTQAQQLRRDDKL